MRGEMYRLSLFQHVLIFPFLLMVVFLITGCGEVRYTENTKIYYVGEDQGATTSTQKAKSDKISMVPANERATAIYVNNRNSGSDVYTQRQDGNVYTIDQHERATAEYNLRKGSNAQYQGKMAKNTTDSAPASQQLPPPPLVLDIDDVLFEFDKYVIRKVYYPELNKWADFFNQNPSLEATIYGHADSTGPTLYNQKLSERRAQAVVDYLVGKGVSASRLKAIGFGETRPIVPNTTKENRQKNRRVEMDY